MRTSEFQYDLPESLIARHPRPNRDESRLMVLAAEGISHTSTRAWAMLVQPGSLVVLNESRVVKARLLGRRRDSGGRVEVLLARPVAPTEPLLEARVWEAIGRASGRLLPGTEIEVGDLVVTILERKPNGILIVRLSVPQLIEQVGRVPIPPYLRREDDASDVDRYQTVYARVPGSVAAPTAGLHLTDEILGVLRARGVRIEPLILHVGLGTFRPVTVGDLDDHEMHAETFVISERLVDAVRTTRIAGAPVVAVGTTVVRALESAAQSGCGELRAGAGETRLLIQPGYGFHVVDALLTNFHEPRSTLLALVSAFAGVERIREAYETAIEQRYRFLSYGDAMWIPQRS